MLSSTGSGPNTHSSGLGMCHGFSKSRLTPNNLAFAFAIFANPFRPFSAIRAARMAFIFACDLVAYIIRLLLTSIEFTLRLYIYFKHCNAGNIRTNLYEGARDGAVAIYRSAVKHCGQAEPVHVHFRPIIIT